MTVASAVSYDPKSDEYMAELADLVDQETTFSKYINREEPYLPPTTLFDRGIIEYTDETRSRHKTDTRFRNFLFRALIRYLSGDWGDVCDVDRTWNNSLVKTARKRDADSPSVYNTTVGGNKVEAFYEYNDGDSNNPLVVYITTEFSPLPYFPNKTKVSMWGSQIGKDRC